jgi:hypothetical protein
MDLFRLEVVSQTEEAATLAFFGHLRHRHLEQLEGVLTAMSTVNRKISLDLRSLCLLDRDAAAFLRRWEEQGAAIVNGHPYVMRWVRQCSERR